MMSSAQKQNLQKLADFVSSRAPNSSNLLDFFALGIDSLDRKVYVNAGCKYIWMTCVIRGTSYIRNVVEYNLNKLSNVHLDQHIRNDYYDLKLGIIKAFTDRRKWYENNRTMHTPQRTAEKQFYRFLQATGITYEVDPMKMPIGRLIQIYSVYFQDLKKLKKDLDKKDQSPYID